MKKENKNKKKTKKIKLIFNSLVAIKMLPTALDDEP